MNRHPNRALLALLLSTLALGGCDEAEGCLAEGGARCVPASPCEGLGWICEDTSLFAGRIGGVAWRPEGLNALGTVGDILMANGEVTVVIDALASPHYLSPTGGTIIDLVRHSQGAGDSLNQIGQVTGILPDDGVAYHSLEVLDEASDRVVTLARGTLDGRPAVEVVTRYELRACEPGVRIRTEVYHGGQDPMTFFLSDVFYWGGREVTPFVPLAGQGFSHPELDLLTIDTAFRSVPFMAGQDHVTPGSAYASVRCDAPLAHAFQSDTVSAAGPPRTIVPPGSGLAYERFIATAATPGMQGVVDVVTEVRAQLFGESWVTLSGQTLSEISVPMGGDPRLVSLLVVEVSSSGALEDAVPWTEIVPAADGTFSAQVPAHTDLLIQPHVLGRPVAATVTFATTGEDLVLDPIALPALATLEVHVVDAGGAPLAADIVLRPTGDTRPEDVRGTVHGYFDEAHCAPYLGPPHGGSPACNRALVDGSGAVSLQVPPGSYFVYATRGPFWTLDRVQVDLLPAVTPEDTVSVSLTLAPIEGLVPEGVLSADFHVHSGASFDSSFPERERALTFVTQGVDVIAATDHDVVTDFTPHLEALGISDQVRVMPGVESTGEILFFQPPGETIPKVMGHFNFWPLHFDASASRNGAPNEERVEPGELYDRVDPLFDGVGVRQLNHPLGASSFGRDHGYVTAVGYDPRLPIPDAPDGSPAGMLIDRPGGPDGHTNLDHHAQEVMNGFETHQFLKYRALWFSLLNQGFMRSGTANSDSHTLGIEVLGWPRTLVFADMDLSTFDSDAFNTAVRDGRMVGTNGPVLLVTLEGADGNARQPALDPFQPAPDASLQLEVRAAPWIPIDELRVIVNGDLVRTLPVDVTPTEPFGSGDLLRYSGAIPLADLLADVPAGRDAWLVVEAGLPLWLAADLDDDGIPETTDNDGDGIVTEADQASDEDTWFQEPPTPAEDDPRYHMDLIAPGTWPTAFSNPLVLDLDGDGWTAPGLAD